MRGWASALCNLLQQLFYWPLQLCLGSSFWAAGTPGGAEPQSRLVCKPSALARHLQRHCLTFRALGCLSRLLPALQSWLGVLWPPGDGLHFSRDLLQLSDEGLVALDWALGAGSHRRRRSSSNSSNPVLLIIGNSFGRITSNMFKLCELALSHGYHPVIYNRRGQNGCPLNTLKLQPFGDPSDLREAIRYIRYQHPMARLYTVSESTGAGLLLSYLGECGSSSYVTAAACISPIFRYQDWFEMGPPWFYHWLLLLYQKISLSRYSTALGEIVDTEKFFASSSIRELEDVLFCQSKKAPLSWELYWERNDPLRDVDEVAIPVLCICSQDDPIRGDPGTTLPFELFETNPHFFLLLTQHGGHCGFLQDTSSDAIWSHEALLEFFRSTTEFFMTEERGKGFGKRKEGGVLFKATRSRGASPYKRESFCSHYIHDIYNWQRSYTR
ncbi:protein ABHD15 [Latimeria chalumnae]|uniref:Protein ABHD15 n=1 Tax=Latimeria chalumnae TaxID=7897 RepID=H3AD46_LATCH|nr:PREDICTED: abhydrolase domain-containing protein 15-like [Latimeria chalumnae]|eukprot:XP_006006164.1 PREDICTED: abhydrolase domain-containing protein 15-like [Latimeria chalumnae]